MERHLAGQERSLVEVRVESDDLDVVHQPRCSLSDHHGCFKCAVALAALMIVGLVAGFILYYFMFAPSCKQDADARVSTTTRLKKSGQEPIYDIFTAEKRGKYLVCGWVKLPEIPSQEITLIQRWNNMERSIKKNKDNKTEISFITEVNLLSNFTISISTTSTITDSLFYIFELGPD